ncbi:hypothetical protein ACFV1N_46960 [Streptosporangium canum]
MPPTLYATDITACCCCGTEVELQHSVRADTGGRRCLGCLAVEASWPPPF